MTKLVGLVELMTVWNSSEELKERAMALKGGYTLKGVDYSNLGRDRVRYSDCDELLVYVRDEKLIYQLKDNKFHKSVLTRKVHRTSQISPHRIFNFLNVYVYHKRAFEEVVVTKMLIILKLNSMVWVRERTIPTERPPLVSEVIANFCGWRCHVVSVTDSYGRILGFLDRSRYFSIK
jgi:hypothetical protein